MKPSNLFKFRSLEQNQYGFSNSSEARKSLSISSRAKKKVFDFHKIFKKILELRRECDTADKERYTAIKSKRVNFCFIQQPSILHSGISITLFDEPSSSLSYRCTALHSTS